MFIERGYRDYYLQVADFSMSFARYQSRGYGARYENYSINGVDFRSFDNDTPLWGSLVGYANSNRRFKFYRGLDFDVEVGLGSAGGGEYLTTRRFEERRMQVGGSVSNRTYSYRLNGVYANSWKNGLSATFEASRRWGRSLSVEGVWSDAWTVAVNVAKEFNDKNSLEFNLIFTPNERSTQRFSTDEAFELTGNTLYNPNWGSQNGKQRSVRSRTNVVPIATLGYTYNISEKSKIVTTIGVAAGQMVYNSINWQNAPNPNPDYYKYMPSFQTDERAKNQLTQLWQSDQNVSQVNFDRIYQVNNQPQAHYVEESRVSNMCQLIAKSTFVTHLKNTSVSAGIEVNYHTETRYKQLEDLMGAQYWLDIDYFIESDDDYKELTQNDVRNPNRKIGVGDQFGYKYSVTKIGAGLWGVVEKRNRNWNFKLGASLNYQSLSRYGYYEKENFPTDQSFGRSATLSSLHYKVKAMVEYRLGTRFSANVAVANLNLPQMAKNSFIDPNYRNAFVENLKNENILTAQLGGAYATSDLRISLNGYATQIANSIEVNHFYDDLQGIYCDYVIDGIDKLFYGGELSLEARLFDHLWLNMAAAVSSNKYTNNPTATQYRQNNGVEIDSEVVNYKGFCVPLSPQNFVNLGLSYNPFGWIASISVNMFGANYVALAPIRYTKRAAQQANDAQLMTQQEKLPVAYTVDLSLGKSFEFNDYSKLGLYAGVSNLTNNRVKTAGYQANRLLRDKNNLYSPMVSKYYYGLGINFYLTATYTF